jgi:hypothetical protein
VGSKGIGCTGSLLVTLAASDTSCVTSDEVVADVDASLLTSIGCVFGIDGRVFVGDGSALTEGDVSLVSV